MAEIIHSESGKLSIAEERRFSELEKTIAKNFKGFVAVGMALAEIRERRLYRAKYRTFEAYCKYIWDVNRVYAHRLIGAAQVVQNLLPIGNKNNNENLGAIAPKNNDDMSAIADGFDDEFTPHFPLPVNEAQARELAKLEPQEQIDVWKDLVLRSRDAGAPITALNIKKAVLEYRGGKAELTIDQAVTEARQNSTDFQSDEFTQAFDAFFEQVKREKESNWRYTSRQTVYRLLQGIIDAVAEAVPGTLKEYGCAMELSDKEKLRKGGFRIFRMDVKNKVIEEWMGHDDWSVVMQCVSATELNDKFKELLSDPRHLKG